MRTTQNGATKGDGQSAQMRATCGPADCSEGLAGNHLRHPLSRGFRPIKTPTQIDSSEIIGDSTWSHLRDAWETTRGLVRVGSPGGRPAKGFSRNAGARRLACNWVVAPNGASWDRAYGGHSVVCALRARSCSGRESGSAGTAGPHSAGECRDARRGEARKRGRAGFHAFER